jgi:hypothetical protein
MNTRPDTLEISFDMLIDVSPAEVPAGGAMMLRCAARATPKRDLRGKLVQVFDATGTIVGTLEFTGLEGATNTTEAVGFVAPAALGPQQWRAVISGVPCRDAAHRMILASRWWRTRPGFWSGARPRRLPWAASSR